MYIGRAYPVHTTMMGSAKKFLRHDTPHSCTRGMIVPRGIPPRAHNSAILLVETTKPLLTHSKPPLNLLKYPVGVISANQKPNRSGSERGSVCV